MSMIADPITAFPLGGLTLTPDWCNWTLKGRSPEKLAESLSQICNAYPKPDRGIASTMASAIEAEGMLTQPAFLSAIQEQYPTLEQTPLGLCFLAKISEIKGNYAESLRFQIQLQDSSSAPNPVTELDLARLYARTNKHVEACQALRRTVEFSSDFQLLTKAAKQLERLKSRASSLCHRQIRLAVLSPYTTDLWLPLLKLALFREGIWAEVYTPHYGTWEMEILNPGSDLYIFSPDVILLAPTWRELNLPQFTSNPDALLEKCTREIVERWRQIRRHCTARIIQHNFEIPATDPGGHLSRALPGGRGMIIQRINQSILHQAASEGVVVLDFEQAASHIGKATWSDASYWHLARQYPAPAALPHLVACQVARIRAGLGLTKKVLVLDLDNTIWGGVIGEDGLGGIKIGPPSATGEAHLALQQYAKCLKERGILLAVCSKNNEEDAKSPFQKHEAMHLKLDDFVAFYANWQDKPTNLRAMAQLLNLGLDSFVFMDDNPTERALMRRELPQVAVPEIGSDPSNYVDILHAKGYFEADSLSAEDLERSRSYQINAQREALKTSAASMEEFLGGLQMECHHGPFTEQVLPRVVQLLGKTNQFNLTTRRHSEEQVNNIVHNPKAWTQFFRLKDRFDDNGLIGLIIAEPAIDDPSTWEIDTWLMSCRVIGRQMENYMFNTLLLAAQDRGIRRLRGRYYPTAKNSMVENLLPGFGFKQRSKEEDFTCHELNVSDAAQAPASFIHGHPATPTTC